MELFQFKVVFIYMFFVKAWTRTTMTTSDTAATSGRNFNITCHTAYNDVIFVNGQTNICLIAIHKDIQSCTFATDCLAKYIYTCDTQNDLYIVTIPGLYIDEVHNTDWFCTYSGGEDSKSNTVTIYVNVPVTSVNLTSGDNKIITVNESQKNALKCKTNPIRPPGTIQWFLNDINITSSAVKQQDQPLDGQDKVISSSVLNYAWTRNDTNKSIHCEASNIEEQPLIKSKYKVLDVNYGPLEIILSPPTLSYIRNESESINSITCTSFCNPRCTYRWEGPGLNISGNIFNVKNLNRTQSGNFECISKNIAGELRQNIHVTVRYQATVQSLTVLPENKVRENSDVTFKCIAKGEPVPKISWHVHTARAEFEYVTNDTSNSTYFMTNVRCEHTGNYTCEAKNRIGWQDNRMESFNVYCAPRFNENCSSNTSLMIRKYKQMRVIACWTANPAPNVTWTLVSNFNVSLSSRKIKTTPIDYLSYPDLTEIEINQIILIVVAENIHGISKPVKFNVTIIQQPMKKAYGTTDSNDRLTTISIVAGVVVGIVVLIVAVFLFRKCRKEGTKNALVDGKSSTTVNRGYCSDLKNKDFLQEDRNDAVGNQGTETVQSKENEIPAYAVVKKPKTSTSKINQKPSDIYAMVKKPHKSKNKDKNDCKESKKKIDQAISDQMDNSGLVYVQLEFDQTQKEKKFVIKESERTEYGEIDFTQKADPLPSDDEDDTPENFTY